MAIVKVNTGAARYTDINGCLHREDGPAITFEDGSEEWYIHGKLHREGGPATTQKYGLCEWWQHDRRHNASGPAMTWPDGSYEYWVYGERHREDGPAIKYVTEKKRWYAFAGTDPWYFCRILPLCDSRPIPNCYEVHFYHNSVHRLGGPAVNNPDGTQEWRVHGRKFTEDEYYLFVDQITGETFVPPGRQLYHERFNSITYP